MFNMVKLNARNMALVHELIAANGGSPFIRRSELLRLHQELRGRKCNPYFITKNIQSKLSAREKLIHPRGTLTLQRYLDHEKRFPLAQAPGKKEMAQKREEKSRREAKQVAIRVGRARAGKK